jgi:hypothetical protein
MTKVTQAGARDLAALAYARRGLPVVPLHYAVFGGRPTSVACSCGEPACARVGAHPLPTHGAADATTDPGRITWWWRRFPEANVGLATGAGFDALVVRGSVGDTSRWLAIAEALRSGGPLVRAGGDTWHFLFAPTGLASPRPWGLARCEWRGRGGWWWRRPAGTPRARSPSGCATWTRACPSCRSPSGSGWNRSVPPSRSARPSTPMLATRLRRRMPDTLPRIRPRPSHQEDPGKPGSQP